MIANIGALCRHVARCVARRGRARQATLFVDAFAAHRRRRGARFWRGTASVRELYNAARRASWARRAPTRRFRDYAPRAGSRGRATRSRADAELVHHVEMQLAGAIGAASARVMVASVVEEEALRHRRGARDPRRSLAGRSRTATTSSRSRASSSRRPPSCGGERAPAGARPPEGRLRLHRHARAAHAAHLDPRLYRDPARQPAGRARAAHALPRHHHQGDRAPHAPHQPGARPSKIESGQAEWHESAGRHARGGRRHRRRHEPGVRGARHQASNTSCPDAVAAGARRRRPHDPGDAQPALERREVLRAGPRADRDRGVTSNRGRCASTCATTARASIRRTRRSSSTSFARSATPSPASRTAAAWACTSAGRSSSTSAGACGSRACPGAAPCFSFTLPT